MSVRSLIRRLAVTCLHRALRAQARPLPEEFFNGGVLVVAPHPDDEALGCGRLIATLRARNVPVDVVWLTDGEASHPDFPGGPAALAALRRAEARAAAAILGVPATRLHHLGAPDGQLPHLPAIARATVVRSLTDLLHSLRTKIVLVTSQHDDSTEHTAAMALISEAVANAESRASLYTYLVWAHWKVRPLWHFFRTRPPLHFVPAAVEATAARTRAIAAHATQTTPQPPDGSVLLTKDFLACFPSRGEFVLRS